MYRGPHVVTKYKYAAKMESPGTGECIRNQSLVLGSETKDSLVV